MESIPYFSPDMQVYGQAYSYENEAQVTAIIRTRNGITGTLCLIGESIPYNLDHFYLYGTKPILQLPDSNGFCGKVALISKKDDTKEVDNTLPYADNSRGLEEIATAIPEGRQNRASKELSVHVWEVIQAMMESSKTVHFVKINFNYEQPLLSLDFPLLHHHTFSRPTSTVHCACGADYL